MVLFFNIPIIQTAEEIFDLEGLEIQRLRNSKPPPGTFFFFFNQEKVKTVFVMENFGAVKYITAFTEVCSSSCGLHFGQV